MSSEGWSDDWSTTDSDVSEKSDVVPVVPVKESIFDRIRKRRQIEKEEQERKRTQLKLDAERRKVSLEDKVRREAGKKSKHSEPLQKLPQRSISDSSKVTVSESEGCTPVTKQEKPPILKSESVGSVTNLDKPLKRSKSRDSDEVKLQPEKESQTPRVEEKVSEAPTPSETKENEAVTEPSPPKKKKGGIFSAFKKKKKQPEEVVEEVLEEDAQESEAKKEEDTDMQLLNPDKDHEIPAELWEAGEDDPDAGPPRDARDPVVSDDEGRENSLDLEPKKQKSVSDAGSARSMKDVAAHEEESDAGSNTQEEIEVKMEEVDLMDEDQIDYSLDDQKVDRKLALERAKRMKSLRFKKPKKGKAGKSKRETRKKQKKSAEDSGSESGSDPLDEGRPFSLCCPPTSFTGLASIGIGLAMYFRFEFMFIWFFLIVTILQLYAIVAHYVLGGNLTDSTLITDSSLGSWGSDNSTNSLFIIGEAFLYLIQFVFFACFLMMMQIDILKQTKKLDRKLTTAADFTVHIRGLRNSDTKERLEEFFGKLGNVHNVEIALKMSKVTKILQHSDALKVRLRLLENRIRIKNRDIKKCKKEALVVDANSRPHTKLEKRRKQLEAQRNNLMKQRKKLVTSVERVDGTIMKLKQKPPRTTRDAFVTFEKEEIAQKYVEEMSKVTCWWRFCRCWTCWCCCGIRQLCCKKRYKYPPLWRRGRCAGLCPPGITARKADEPDDIFWLNLGLGACSRFWRSVKSWTIVLILVILNMAGIITLELYKDQIRSGVAGAGIFVVEAVTRTQAVVVVFTNYLMKKILILLAGMERKRTKTEFETSLVWSLTFAQVANSVLVPFIASGLSVFIENIQSTTDVVTMLNAWKDALYIEGGLAEQVFIIVLINAFLPDLVHILQPGHNLKKHCCSRMKCCRKSQAFMDKLVEPPDFILAERYAAVMKTILMSLVYGPMIPLAYPITFLGLILTIVVDYVLVLRVYKKPPSTAHQVALATKKIMSIGFLAHILCTAFFYTLQTWKNPPLGTLTLSIPVDVFGVTLTAFSYDATVPDFAGDTGNASVKSISVAAIMIIGVVFGLLYLIIPCTCCCRGSKKNKGSSSDESYQDVPGIQKYELPALATLKKWKPGARDTSGEQAGGATHTGTRPSVVSPQMIDLGGVM